MTAGGDPRDGLRVERALRLLPDIDALVPLRAILVSASRGRRREEPHRTVGKQLVRTSELPEYARRAAALASDHLATLFEAAVGALRAEEHGDEAAAVRSLLTAGVLEERVGRRTPARAWYEHALRIAEGLRDRGPELDTLLHLGHLEAVAGSLDASARHFQRCLVLAEAAGAGEPAALAAEGLGRVAAAQGRWSGAASWFARAIGQAGADDRLTARILRSVAEVAFERGRIDEAGSAIARSRSLSLAHGDREGLGLLLNLQGRIDARARRFAEGLDQVRGALALLQEANARPAVELGVRLTLGQLLFESERLPEAEDELRRAEELAIMHNLTLHLARLYVLMGKVRGLQQDETGFVFFEKAIELCRGREPSPVLEAETYLEYAVFRRQFGEVEESRAYLERAREIFETSGDRPTLARVDAELAQLPAS